MTPREHIHCREHGILVAAALINVGPWVVMADMNLWFYFLSWLALIVHTRFERLHVIALRILPLFRAWFIISILLLHGPLVAYWLGIVDRSVVLPELVGYLGIGVILSAYVLYALHIRPRLRKMGWNAD